MDSRNGFERMEPALQEWLALLPELLQNEMTGFTGMAESKVFVEGVPVGKARPRFTRQGRCYTPAGTKQAERQAQQAGQLWHRGDRLSGQIGVLVLAVFPVPKSWSKQNMMAALEGIIRPAVKPDFDNVAKLYCDALNGIVWEDDKQIVDGRCIKCYGQQPGVLIVCRKLDQN